MSDQDSMSDLSFTKTKRAMQSKPMGRRKYLAKSVIQLANESKNTKTIVRYTKHSDPSYFTGC